MCKEKNKTTMSPLNKTWIFDLDGTIVKHNGYKTDGKDSFLEGAKEFLLAIPEGDMIIFLTSRTIEYAKITEDFFSEAGIQYDYIIYDAPYGERILMNDDKLSGLPMAYAFRTTRNQFPAVEIKIDESL